MWWIEFLENNVHFVNKSSLLFFSNGAYNTKRSLDWRHFGRHCRSLLLTQFRFLISCLRRHHCYCRLPLGCPPHAAPASNKGQFAIYRTHQWCPSDRQRGRSFRFVSWSLTNTHRTHPELGGTQTPLKNHTFTSN